MSSHLLKCLKEEEFTLFLKSRKHTKLSRDILFTQIFITYVGAYSMKRIPREMKICLWQNMLNVVNGTTKCLKIPSLIFTNKSVERKCIDVRTKY